jgi:hypothetical protein
MCVSLQLQKYETYQNSQDKTDKNNIKYNFRIGSPSTDLRWN